MGVWERRYYRVLNAWMRFLLRSPLHRLRSGRLVLLEFSGRRSGRRYVRPVSYWQPDADTLVCMSSAAWSRWWANLDGGVDVAVRLRGDERSGRASLVSDPPRRLELVKGFFASNSHDAHHYGVETDGAGAPLDAGLAELARSPDAKVIAIELVS